MHACVCGGGCAVPLRLPLLTSPRSPLDDLEGATAPPHPTPCTQPCLVSSGHTHTGKEADHRLFRVSSPVNEGSLDSFLRRRAWTNQSDRKARARARESEECGVRGKGKVKGIFLPVCVCKPACGREAKAERSGGSTAPLPRIPTNVCTRQTGPLRILFGSAQPRHLPLAPSRSRSSHPLPLLFLIRSLFLSHRSPPCGTCAQIYSQVLQPDRVLSHEERTHERGTPIMAKTSASHAMHPPNAIAAAATNTSAATTPTPSFLVYPVPSIADESFLQLIFRNTVKRSLFLGFGRGRFAVTELTSATVAAEVEAIIHKAAVAAVGQQDSVVAPRDANGTAAEVEAAHSALERMADDDALEHMALADLFAPPPRSPSHASASVHRQEHQPSSSSTNGSGSAAAGGESNDFSHIPYLVWRDKPVHVVVSGVRVEDFYSSGGVVPVHHVKRSADEEGKCNSKPKRPSTVKRPREDGADSTAELPPSSSRAANRRAVVANTAMIAAAAATAPKSLFPKNCCQKCGSADHFTRHCDGSGAATGPSAAADADADTGSPRTSSATAALPFPAVAKTTVVSSFPKNCCQKCGSADHFTRHCTSSSSSNSASVSAVPSSFVTAHANKKPDREAFSATVVASTPLPAKTKAKAVVQRTSKDQCRYCGSEAHLSRHCPSKSQ
ncbi:Zinc knuckle, putative [Leishmania guyanensis]